MQLLMATTNKGKAAELRALLTGLDIELDIEVVTLDQLVPAPPPVEETLDSFTGNALLKASQYHRWSGMLTLADDSGLEVDALGGRPGVRSAEYGGVGLGSAERNALLLGEMRDVPVGSRGARFVCALALVGAGVSQTFLGYCEGEISTAPTGGGGFGYDPIFIYADTGLSFASLSRDEKSRRSHRGRAMSALLSFLNTLR